MKGIIINYLETVGRNGYFDNLVLCTYVADDDTLQSEQRCRDKSFTLLPSSPRELSKRIRKQVSIQRTRLPKGRVLGATSLTFYSFDALERISALITKMNRVIERISIRLP